MASMFYTLLITYIIGGLTFVPFIVIGALAYAFYTATPSEPRSPRNKLVDDEQEKPASTTSSQTALKSWLTVRHTFEPSPSSYISIVRTLLDARSAHPRRAEDAFYSVLKGSVLYLYEDEAMMDCSAAIDVTQCSIRVYPDQGLLDGELFAKRNAILIRQTDSSSSGENTPSDDSSQRPAPWFFFFRSVTAMEDWYIALLTARSPENPTTFAPFPYAAHKSLITSLDALPDLIPTRWLNALLGRLFLGVKDTSAVEAWVVGRLMKKLAKVKTPSFLRAVVVRSFEAGDVAPVLSKPMLKELTPEGEASVGVDVLYAPPPGGEMRMTVSATATISLPTTASLSLLGFKNKDKDTPKDKEKEKPYEVSLVLAIVVRRVEGNVLFKVCISFIHLISVLITGVD
ncbi:hypothetical protein K439DRAFT_487274 [Ramaria rubella]|nr:hypothetical protein K439DRAFT_487274 [Ramaria rubella]